MLEIIIIFIVVRVISRLRVARSISVGIRHLLVGLAALATRIPRRRPAPLLVRVARSRSRRIRERVHLLVVDLAPLARSAAHQTDEEEAGGFP